MEQKIKQDNLIRIGANIKKLRIAKDLYQNEMVDLICDKGIKISRVTYAKIEMGTHHLSASLLEAIRDILGTTYEELLKHTDQAPDSFDKKEK